ncbi:PIN domain-containing protein [Reichenbachiella versicolor]|uniref:PIN domain-containing protein n=1 Tax=Reichenbachiella versicolor TaxID=1821036 RepID=UPI001FE54D3D|nr:PIN domain-containing protein [Reichenbachiella versicolor]
MRLINSARFTAVLDANVLFPIVIRDYLLWLATYELYSPKWSKTLLDEFSSIFSKKKMDLTMEQIRKQIDWMNKACPDALVEKYETLIETVKLPDQDDRHVVAAALKCNANVIVTNNLKDFPTSYIESLGLNIIDPDTFIADMIDLSPDKCTDAFREMVLKKRKPPYDEIQYLEILRKNGLHQTADELSKYV